MKLTDYIDNHSTLRVLIAGLSGSGKTTLAATLARKYHLWWVDLENSIETLAKLPREWQENITLIRIPDSASFPVAAQTIQKLFKDGKGNICEAHGVISCSSCTKATAPFQLVDFSTLDARKDVVVLDSLTQVGYSFLSHLLKSQPIDYKPEWDDWGGLRRHTEYLAANIQAIKFNLVATALPAEVKMEDGRMRLVPAFGSRDMSAGIGAKFGTVIYCDVKNKTHFAYSSSTASNSFLSKSRFDYKIEDQGDLDLCKMFEAFFARGNSSNAEPAIIASPSKVVEPVKSSAQSALQNLRARTPLVTKK